MKKKKGNINKGNTKNRFQRLCLAPGWISAHRGKSLVRGYAKHFRVDLLCAIMDLRMLGMAVSDEYEKSIRQNMEARAGQKQKKKEVVVLPEAEGYFGEDYFAFVAGCTSGGAAYGLSREEYPILTGNRLRDSPVASWQLRTAGAI